MIHDHRKAREGNRRLRELHGFEGMKSMASKKHLVAHARVSQIEAMENVVLVT